MRERPGSWLDVSRQGQRSEKALGGCAAMRRPTSLAGVVLWGSHFGPCIHLTCSPGAEGQFGWLEWPRSQPGGFLSLDEFFRTSHLFQRIEKTSAVESQSTIVAASGRLEWSCPKRWN